MHKILVLTSTFPRWRNDTEPPFIFELCKRLANHLEVYVLAPHTAGALTFETLDGLHVVRFRYFFEPFETLCYQGGILAKLRDQPFRMLLIPFFIGFQILAARRLLKTEKIAVIHAHWLIPQGLIASLVRRLIQRPIVFLCTSHGGDLFSLKGRLATFLKKKILLDASAVSVVNSVMANEVLALCKPFQPNVSIIPMGVDFERIFVPASEKKQPFSLIFVGRLVEKKGVDYLLNALPAIINAFPETHLTIVGAGPELSRLKTLANDLSVTHCVDFIGTVKNEDLPAYYRRHQIAVFPFIVAANGDREGLPVVVSEAIGCGCCVVTTDLPGIEDIIVHEHNGLIVAQKSDTSIANAVVDLFSDAEKMQRLASTAYTSIKDKQDWEVIGNRYTRLIESLI